MGETIELYAAAQGFDEEELVASAIPAMVETGSTGDTVIFEEFKGTGNAELKLDRAISERRIFPAWRAFAERTHLTAWRTLQSDGQALLGQMGWGKSHLPSPA